MIIIIILLGVLLCAALSVALYFFKQQNTNVAPSEQPDNSHAEFLEGEVKRLNENLSDKETKIQELVARNSELATSNTILAEQQKVISDIVDTTKTEFAKIASEAVKDQADDFRTANRKELEESFGLISSALETHRTRLETLSTEQEKRQSEISERVENTANMQRIFVETTRELSATLRGDSRALGAWGEQQIEHLLEQAGLIKGVNYNTQVYVTGSGGDQRIIDVLVNLPGGNHIIIDVKTSINSYAEYASETDSEAKEKLAKKMVSQFRSHVKSLSSKEYWRSGDVSSPSFVILFMPLESVYMEVMRADRSLLTDALDLNVMLCSPTTLLPMLLTIGDVWSSHMQISNLRELMWTMGETEKRVATLQAAVQKLGKTLTSSRKAYQDVETALEGGNGSLVESIDRFKSLSNNIKSDEIVPAELVESNISENVKQISST